MHNWCVGRLGDRSFNCSGRVFGIRRFFRLGFLRILLLKRIHFTGNFQPSAFANANSACCASYHLTLLVRLVVSGTVTCVATRSFRAKAVVTNAPEATLHKPFHHKKQVIAVSTAA